MASDVREKPEECGVLADEGRQSFKEPAINCAAERTRS